MARQLTPEELDALLGAYALGAVDDDERAQVEVYVAEHRAAAAELEQLQDAAVWLAVSGAPASRDLWDRISAATKPEPPPLRLPDRRRASSSTWFTPRRVLALAAAFVFVIAVGIGVVVESRRFVVVGSRCPDRRREGLAERRAASTSRRRRATRAPKPSCCATAPASS